MQYRSGRRRHFYFCVLLVPLLFFFSCDSSPPELQQLYWQLNLIHRQDPPALYESLSLWVQAEDEDGLDDIEYIYLINDNEELMWELSEESWRQVSRPGETWFGTNDVSTADGSGLPRGEYRIILLDTVGERAERSFYLSIKEKTAENLLPPEVEIENGEVSVSNVPYGFTLWGYKSNGEYISSAKDLPGSFGLEMLKEELPGIAEFYIYTYEINRGFGIISGPYKMPEQGADN